ncbi:MAG: DNA/RNA non-specific endonuclease [Muribaculaceae bacterium]|nr:DNA/RNA non-specific endonuclease [Muribaculaceae bacterium]
MKKHLRTSIFCVLAAVIALLGCSARCSKNIKDRPLETIPAISDTPAHTPAPAEAKQPSASALWNGPGLPVTAKAIPSKVLERTGYVTSYNQSTLLPNWTAWVLTAEHTQGSNKRNGIPYAADTDVNPRQELSDWSDAGRLGYDHGHMCPAGDNKWSAQAMTETFLLTNMCPQARRLNQETWERLESASRNWAQRLGKLYIVCGPIYRSNPHKRLGSSDIHLPDAFYKVLLYMGKDGTEARAIGFVYDNCDPADRENMQNHVVAISEIEKATGITFFPNLTATQATALKNVTSFNKWNKF